MSTAWTIAAIAVAAVLLYRWLFMPSLGRDVARAMADGDVGPLQRRLAELPADAQPLRYDTAIQRLWVAYRRDLAAPLIGDLARQHEALPLAHYWLMQLQDVEPEIAQAALGRDFIAGHYQPQLAAQCGKFG